jgi:hypothetical protein
MQFLPLTLVAFLLLEVTPAHADDMSAIRKTVFDYLEGINTVDRERLERAFAPGAMMKSVSAEGELRVVPITDAIDRWTSREPGSRSGRILSVDLHDELARVVFDYDGGYIDLLTLAKIQDQWRILDKAFITLD